MQQGSDLAIAETARPDTARFIIVAPPSIHDAEEWLRQYAPQHQEWRDERWRQRLGPTEEVIYPDRPGGYVWRREEVPVGDPARLA